MAARFKTKEHTLSGSAESLSSILNDPFAEYVGSLVVRAKHTNVGDVNWEDDGSESGGFLQPGEAASWDLTGKFVKASEVYFNGTASDVINITVIG